FLFQASRFADVKGQWGINFALFAPGTGSARDSYPHDLIDIVGHELAVVGTKPLYNSDAHTKMSDWYRAPLRGLPTGDAPQLTNSTGVKQRGRGRLTDSAIGYFYSSANSVYDNQTCVALFTSTCSAGNGTSIEV